MYDGAAYCLPTGVYDPELYGAMTLLSPEKHNPNFDPKKLPWSTAPQYVQDIVYMSLEQAGTSQLDYSKYKMPFICVRVYKTYVYVYVGYNIAIGYNVKYDRFRLCVVHKFYDNSACYHAIFNTDYEIQTDWRKLEATQWSDTFVDEANTIPFVKSFTPTFCYLNSVYDLYFYGGNGVYVGNYASVSYPLSDTHNVQFMVNNDVGFQSGNFIPKQNDEGTSLYCEYFTPPSASAQQSQLQEEEVKTSKGIWETLKSIPDMIAEKFKSLFIPPDGYFETLTNEFKEYFSDRLGVIYELPEAVITIFQQLIEFEPLSDGYYIPIPEVSIPIRLEDGSTQNFRILEAQDYRFDFLSEGAFGTLYTFYRSFCWLVCIFGLISLAIKTYTDITDE